MGKGCCWIGQNTLISVYGITVLTQRKHCNLELSTTSSLFLVLDRAIRECFPKLLRLVSAYVNHCLLRMSVASAPALKPFGSCLDHILASEP